MAKHFLVNEHKYKNVLIEAHRLIYFELPKNACTSMKKLLAEVLQLPKRSDFPRYIHKDKYYSFPHANLKELETTYKDFFRFAIIRNPWERLVSCYKDKIFYKNEDNTYFIKTNPQFSKGMPFDEFVDLVVNTPDHLADFHFCSQLSLLTAFDGNFMCNYLAELDSLNTHFNEISAITGITFPNIPQLNTTKKASYEAFYTAELVEKVRIRYQHDIDFFQYEFSQKNDAFHFGLLNKPQLEQLKDSLLMVSILKEKNKELQGIIEKIDTTTKSYQQTISWKITAPLRSVGRLLNK